MNLKLFNFKRAAKVARGYIPALLTRGFNAAEVSHLLAGWRWDGGFSNSQVVASLASIRAKSRDMEKNSPHYAKWLSLFTANVVGEGFRLKSLASKSNDDFTVDATAARFIEYHFDKWASNPYLADAANVKSLADIYSLAASNWARDGEAFILIDRHAQNRYGISLRVIRPDCIDETYNVTTPSLFVRGGVEIDRTTDRPVAYYFNASKTDTSGGGAYKTERIRYARRDVIHLFLQRDAAQVRGIPLSHAVLCKLKMLDEYDKCELTAARDESATIGFFHASSGAAAAKMLDAKTAESMASAVEAGKKMILPPDWSYETKTPQHPNREVTAFKNSMLRDIASGLGVEYANFANDWGGVSYSSVRAGTLAERDQWISFQRIFKTAVCERVFFAWLHSFLSLAVSGEYDEKDFERLQDHQFVGRRWLWVDPLRDVNAAAVAVAHGWKTDAQIAAEYGTDIDDNLEEANRIKAAKDSAGLISAGGLPPEKEEKNED